MKRRELHIGTISEGTLIPEEIGDSLAWDLERLRLTRDERKTVNEYRRFRDLEGSEAEDGLSVDELVSELENIADAHCPPYTYYGSLDGGVCFGVWPITDDEDLERYPAGESPNGSGDCYEVTDHGNLSCGRRLKNGRWVEYWRSVV